MNEMKSKSLASTVPGLLSPALPAALGGEGGALVDYVPRSIVPYIHFATMKSPDLWAKCVAADAGTRDGDQFLVSSDGSVTKLTPMKCGLFCAKQYWCTADQSGMIHASWEERPDPYKENFESVLLVYLPSGGVRIVTCNFRSAKCGAAQTLSAALKAAASPDWGKKSETHAMTLACNQPYMRFFAVVQLGATRTSKQGKGAGNKYTPASATIHPTSVAEWKALAEAFKDEAYVKSLAAADLQYANRLQQVEDAVTRRKAYESGTK